MDKRNGRGFRGKDAKDGDSRSAGDGHAPAVLGATDRSGFRLSHLRVEVLTLFGHDGEVGSWG